MLLIICSQWIHYLYSCQCLRVTANLFRDPLSVYWDVLVCLFCVWNLMWWAGTCPNQVADLVVMLLPVIPSTSFLMCGQTLIAGRSHCSCLPWEGHLWRERPAQPFTAAALTAEIATKEWCVSLWCEQVIKKQLWTCETHFTPELLDGCQMLTTSVLDKVGLDLI